MDQVFLWTKFSDLGVHSYWTHHTYDYLVKLFVSTCGFLCRSKCWTCNIDPLLLFIYMWACIVLNLCEGQFTRAYCFLLTSATWKYLVLCNCLGLMMVQLGMPSLPCPIWIMDVLTVWKPSDTPTVFSFLTSEFQCIKHRIKIFIVFFQGKYW